jgi:hypothetical protein
VSASVHGITCIITVTAYCIVTLSFININLYDCDCKYSCSCYFICILFLVCSVSFIGCVVLCCVLFERDVLLRVMCYLCVVSYCITTATGINQFGVKINNIKIL